MMTAEILGNEVYWNKSLENLLHKEYVTDAKKNELITLSVLNKTDIIEQLLNGTYEWSIPEKFLIKKSGTNKFRVVYVYSLKDRLILGVLYHALNEIYKQDICEYCYSYKEGVNTAKAIRVLRNTEIHKMYGVKLDIHSYFNSVSVEYLHKMIEDMQIEPLGFKKSIENLMYTDVCRWHGKEITEYKSLIAGNPVASFFANYCLRELDFEFYNAKKLYARYSDDIILFAPTKDEVNASLDVVKKYLADRGLTINPSKYEYFEPNSEITFLGLKLRPDGVIDISQHSKEKIKRYIHNLCNRSRKHMELNYTTFAQNSKFVVKKINYKNFKCYIQNENTFGWCHYAFRYITTDESLKEIDLYTKDRLRYLKTGKNNKANYTAISDAEFKEMGWVSLVQLYHLYKQDFDYYCEVISLI